GQEQSMLALCDKRCMVRTMPPVVKMKAVDERLRARPGETVPCRLVLERTSLFAGPMDVELISAPAEVTADKVRFGAGESAAATAVRLGPGVSLKSAPALKFRATGRLQGEAVAVTEVTVAVQLD